MPDTTDRLALPVILADQAQKHVTHNDALIRLDALVHLAVHARDLTEPPADPLAGDRYIVSSSASGDWIGQGGNVAVWQDGAWMFLEPRAGWRAWCSSEGRLLLHDGAGWTSAVPGAEEFSSGTLSRLGVNTAADDNNRLAVKTSAVLISHDDVSGSGNGSVLGTFNKEGAGKDAGFNFQSGWSTRALMGLYGDDDFRLKVSPDGATFHDAIAVERTTGRVTFPQTAALEHLAAGLFRKADPASVAFTRTGTGTLNMKAGTLVGVAGFVHAFAAPTAVEMPALVPGTDYAIYVCSDGSVKADANFQAPSGHTTADSRKVGGFHYAAGGNAGGYNTGGDGTPQINPYSLWDLKWRPACADPRGMALVAGQFWCDIYLTGTNVDVDGSSRAGATIATGSVPPKVPGMFGGDGVATYGSLTWYEATELLSSVGKRLLGYGDFSAAAFGTLEAASRGSDPVTTGLATTNVGASNHDRKFTSKWGVTQATGCLWVWGNAFGGPYANNWGDNTEGRGQTFSQPNAVRLGGSWSNTGYSGSRTAYWFSAPSASIEIVGARGRADHMREA
ncbi:DUF2793 domain-containing protein [Jiella mangrovi]|uniref:DUF2793 domain-containing protein n=1 Tax=Jiella mangrovi TaxID=2821407 RepID=A0ABS4BGR5_9HYPH|nr:DUF2793 domain-containing protein [Jiella mangrovi]MBP0615140.1 DUF2793 domain-containing protein [Jiella mangrovi]